jgi:hypothetical protein
VEGVPPILLLIDEAEPRPPPMPVVLNPPSGCPKKPFTVVLF